MGRLPLSGRRARRVQPTDCRLVDGDDLAYAGGVDALDTALGQRRPSRVIHHSDRGSRYTSIAFGKRCREAAVRPSVGSVGDAYDNAMAESFFATLECELLDRRRFKTQAEARLLFARRWGRSETPTIMRWRRVSSPRSNVSCSIGADSRRRPRRASPSSNSSRASTIRGGGTHRLGISTSAATTRERLIPAHTIVPPCSGPSSCGLEMAEYVSTPARRPTLTAPARAGVRDVWAGTEKRTPQGPNRKTAVNRRTRCRLFRYLAQALTPPRNRGKSRQRKALPTTPPGQPQQRTFDLLSKPDIFTC